MFDPNTVSTRSSMLARSRFPDLPAVAVSVGGGFSDLGKR